MTINDIKLMLNYGDKRIVTHMLDQVNLTEQEIVIINLVDLQGLTYEQTSERLACSTSTIYRKRHMALKKMLECWKEVDIKELTRN